MPINLSRYTKFFLFTTLGCLALSIAMALVLDLSMPPGLITILAAMVAANFEGAALARENGQFLEGSEATKAALAMTFVAFVFTAVLYIVQLAIPRVATALADISRGFFYGLMAFLAVLVFLINRIFMVSGMKSVLDKQTGKAE